MTIASDDASYEHWIFIRTDAGAREVIAEADLLNQIERHLLLVVNGFTPLRYLARAGLGQPDVLDGIKHLQQAGYVTRCADVNPM